MISQDTMTFSKVTEVKDIKKIIQEVCAAMEEKGYNSVDQIVGYILTSDPTYITSYKDARTKIREIERYEIIEALLKNYLKQ